MDTRYMDDVYIEQLRDELGGAGWTDELMAPSTGAALEVTRRMLSALVTAWCRADMLAGYPGSLHLGFCEGLYWCREGDGSVTAVDNTSGSCLVEGFPDKLEALDWLLTNGLPGDHVRPLSQLSQDELEQAWSDLGDALVDDDGRLLGAWRDYPAGTDREEIWLDFDAAYGGGVHSLMFEREKGVTMKGLLIPVVGNPTRIEVRVGEDGTTLADLQRHVGGDIEPFDVIFGEGVSLYVNADGIGTEPPNRAVYATKAMQETGYLSQLDFSRVVQEGELYSVLFGPIVALGFDPETGESRDLSPDDASAVIDYFTRVSPAGSGLFEAARIRSRGDERENPPLMAPQWSLDALREADGRCEPER